MQQLPYNPDIIRLVTFDPTTVVQLAPKLASGSGDKTIKIWNLGTGQLIRTLEGHSESVNSVAISPDGKTLASGIETIQRQCC